jgi:hypothetical protein
MIQNRISPQNRIRNEYPDTQSLLEMLPDDLEIEGGIPSGSEEERIPLHGIDLNQNYDDLEDYPAFVWFLMGLEDYTSDSLPKIGHYRIHRVRLNRLPDADRAHRGNPRSPFTRNNSLKGGR